LDQKEPMQEASTWRPNLPCEVY